MWLSQHSNWAFTCMEDCETEPHMPNATASYSVSHLTDIVTVKPPKRAVDSSLRAPLTMTGLRLLSLCLSRPPRSSQRQQLQPALRRQTDCACSLAVQPGSEKGNLGQKCQEFEKFFFLNEVILWKNLQQSTEQACSLMPGYHRKFRSLDS